VTGQDDRLVTSNVKGRRWPRLNDNKFSLTEINFHAEDAVGHDRMTTHSR